MAADAAAAIDVNGVERSDAVADNALELESSEWRDRGCSW